MIQNKSSGSALLIVLIIGSILLLCCTKIFRSYAFNNSLVTQRYFYEQQLRLTEALLIYGIAFCRKYVHDLMPPEKNDHTVKLRFGPWTLSNKKEYQGILTISSSPQGCKLDAQLGDAHNKNMHGGTCMLAVDSAWTTITAITGWKTYAV